MLMSRRACFVVSVGILIGRVTNVGADPAKDVAELAKLKGHWRPTSWVIGGLKDDQEYKRREFKVAGARITFITDGREVGAATLKVDSGEKPYHMDITYEDGPMKGMTVKGIYKFEDGDLVTCFNPPGEERPTTFESKPGTKAFLSVDKRLKD